MTLPTMTAGSGLAAHRHLGHLHLLPLRGAVATCGAEVRAHGGQVEGAAREPGEDDRRCRCRRERDITT